MIVIVISVKFITDGKVLTSSANCEHAYYKRYRCSAQQSNCTAKLEVLQLNYRKKGKLSDCISHVDAGWRM
jgi:hypothetical protein